MTTPAPAVPNQYGWRLFILLFLLCFGVRVGYAVLVDLPSRRSGEFADKPLYEMERAGASVARSGEIRDVYGADSGPTAHVSPVYAWTLGLLYRLAGPDWGRRRLAQEVSSAAISSLLIALLPTVARRTGLRPSAGTSAALVMALVPAYLDTEVSGEWEQPVSTLTLLILLLDAAARSAGGWRSGWRALASGALLGWATLLSPPVALAGFSIRIAQALSDRVDAWRIARSFAVECLVVAAILVPWTLRNLREVGAFVPLRSNFGLELYVGNHDRSTGYSTNLDFRTRHPYLNRGELDDYLRLGERDYMREKSRAAGAWIGGHPVAFLRLSFGRLLIYWFPPRPFWYNNGFSSTKLAFLPVVYFGAVTLLALAGLARLFRRGHPWRWVYAAALLAPSLVYYVTHVAHRYRYLTYPVSLLLAMEILVATLPRLAHRWPGPWRAPRA